MLVYLLSQAWRVKRTFDLTAKSFVAGMKRPGTAIGPASSFESEISSVKVLNRQQSRLIVSHGRWADGRPLFIINHIVSMVAFQSNHVVEWMLSIHHSPIIIALIGLLHPTFNVPRLDFYKTEYYHFSDAKMNSCHQQWESQSELNRKGTVATSPASTPPAIAIPT